MPIYRCKHFIIQELVPPEVYAERGERAWEMLDSGLLVSLDAYRGRFGPIIVNDWHVGGQFKESGLRVPDTGTGAKWSAHKFGRGADCKPKSCKPRDMYDYVLKHPDEFPHVNRVENIAATPTWFHSDTMNSATRIVVVNP